MNSVTTITCSRRLCKSCYNLGLITPSSILESDLSFAWDSQAMILICHKYMLLVLVRIDSALNSMISLNFEGMDNKNITAFCIGHKQCET